MKGALAMDRSALHRYIEADAAALPGAGSHGLEGLPVPRRGRGRAERRAQWGLQARAAHCRGAGGAAGSVGAFAAGKGNTRRTAG